MGNKLGKVLMKIILSLFLVFNTSYLFSHPENHSRIELVKPFVNSLEQEAHIFGLNLTPNSIMVTKDFIGNPSNQTLLKLRPPSKRDKYTLRVLDKDNNELLTLGIGNPFYAYAHHIGFEDREVMGGPVSSAKIEIAIPTNLNAKFLAISARDLNSNLNEIQRVELP